MLAHLIHMIRIAAVGSSFVFFFAGGWILSWTLLPITFVLSGKNPKPCQRIVQHAFALFHAYMRWWGLMVYQPWNTPDLPIHDPCIIIANHPSLVDVTAIMSRYEHIHCFVKASLFRHIAVGPLLRCCGHISAGDGIHAIQQAQKALQSGARILIFPEGTRSPPGGIGPFESVAFRLAAHTRTPICALKVTTSEPALGKGTPWYRFPKRPVMLQVQHFACFSPANAQKRNGANLLAEHVRAWYNAPNL